jgi:hypothetical protein
MKLPQEWTKGKTIIVELLRNIYGLKQAGLLWYTLLNEVLLQYGFQRTIHDPCVYVYNNDNKIILLVIYVDDIIITTKNQLEIDQLLEYLLTKFQKMTINKIKTFIGVQFINSNNNNKLTFSMNNHITKYLEEHLINKNKNRNVPIPGNYKPDPTQSIITDRFYDQVGKIRYLADRERPDLQYAASLLGSEVSSPTLQTITLLQHLWEYINTTIEENPTITNSDLSDKLTLLLYAYADAAQKFNKAQLGFIIFLGASAGAIIVKSFINKIITLSITEAELCALVECIKEVIWTRFFLEEIGFKQVKPTVIFEDNAALIALCEKVGNESGTKHHIKKLNFVREQINNGTIILHHVDSENNVADFLT